MRTTKKPMKPNPLRDLKWKVGDFLWLGDDEYPRIYVGKVTRIFEPSRLRVYRVGMNDPVYYYRISGKPCHSSRPFGGGHKGASPDSYRITGRASPEEAERYFRDQHLSFRNPSEAVLILQAIDRLRVNEGSCVTICCDNADFNGLPLPNCAIDVCDDWTNWEPLTFRADTVLEALMKAEAAKRGTKKG